MGWNPVKAVSDAVSSVGQGIENSVNQIVDSGGDFIRAVGRGDLGAAGEDLLSIGWEATNLVTGGTLNITADAIKRALAPDIPPVDYQDRKVMSRDASEARKVVYGRTRVGATVRYIESSGTDSNTLHLICIFATHTCSDIEKVYFNDELAFIGTTAQGKYSGKAEMIFETGKQTTANAAIVAATPSGWTNNHKLLGHTYAYIKLTYDNDVYQGVPNVSAIVKGKDDIYDPRTATSGWTDNHALVVRDYLAREYGVAYFDEQSFIDGANTCDELVASGVGTTEPRYTANGLYSVAGDPADTLDSLLAAGVAGIQYVQGLVRYVPGVYQAPGVSASFSEGDFIGGLQIIPTSDAQDRINAIRGTYIDPAQDYEVVDFVPIVIDEYVTQDKQELYEDSRFPWTDSGTAARRLAKTFLERSRYGVRLSCTLKFSAFEFSVGDRIKISVAGLGWTDKIFRIESMKLSINGCDVSLQEDGPSVWAWEEGDALALDVPPALNLPNPYQVSQPTGFGATESLYIANDKKTIRSRISFSWDGSVTALRWELQGSYQGGEFKSISDYLTVPVATLDDAQIGEWIFRVRAVNGIGVKSDWTSIPFTALGKTAPPADVTGFVAVVKPFGIELTWNAVPDLDLDRYEIRLGAVWESATKLQAISALRWQWETRPTGSEQLLIKAIDTTDNYSTNAASASLVISNPLKPDPFSAQVMDSFVLFTWADATTSFAIDHYIITRGDDFSGSAQIYSGSSTAYSYFETQRGDYTYWVYAVDVAGNTGEPAKIVATVDSPPDFVLQADRFLDLSDGTSVNCLSIGGALFTADMDTITADSTDFTADMADTSFLLAPIDTTSTWEQHFVNNSFTTPQDQVSAGYPLYLQPTPSTAYWEQEIDFFGVLGISRIKLQVSSTDTGTVSRTTTISYSLDGISWTDFIGTDVVAKNFRYVKVRFDFAVSDGVSYTTITSARLTLEVKERTESGMGSAVASDVGGTVVNFTTEFTDVSAITITPNATVPVLWAYDFDDVPNPTGFKVLIYDAAGTRIDCPFSYIVRGV